MKTFVAVFALCLAPLAHAETLTDKKGRAIEGRVVGFSDYDVKIVKKGDELLQTWISLKSLDGPTLQMLKQRKAEMEDEAAKAKKELEEKEREISKRREEAKAKSVDFRGIWIGMNSKEIDRLLEVSPLAWSGYMTLKPSRQSPEGLTVIATNGNGEKFHWEKIEYSLHLDEIYRFAVCGPSGNAAEIDLSIKDWLKAVREALVQKYGQTKSDTNLSALSILDTKAGFTTRLASWDAGKMRVTLRISQDAHFKFRAEIQYEDAAIAEMLAKREKEVKGGL